MPTCFKMFKLLKKTILKLLLLMQSMTLKFILNCIWLDSYSLLNNCFFFLLHTGFVRVRLNQANQAKSVFLKKIEKRQAKSVFFFKNLRMSVFVSSNA